MSEFKPLHPAALDLMQAQADLGKHWVPISPKDLHSLINEVKASRKGRRVTPSEKMVFPLPPGATKAEVTYEESSIASGLLVYIGFIADRTKEYSETVQFGDGRIMADLNDKEELIGIEIV